MQDDGFIRSLWASSDVQSLGGSQVGSLSFRSLAQTDRLILSQIHRFSGKFDFVTGIPRSGLMLGTLLALHLNIPFVSLNDLVIGNHRQRMTQRPPLDRSPDRHAAELRGLVVDDSINLGNTTRKVRARLDWLRSEGIGLEYLAVYATASASGLVDHHLETLEQPRVFEWNFLHHAYTQKIAIDLDGILCVDGPREVSNDGGHYESYIANAQLKYKPSVPVGAIVTSRLSRYRGVTEAWLARHGIQYNQLIMLDLETAERRRELMVHAKFKADVYRELDAVLFVESEEWQAREIAQLSERPVCWLQGATIF